MNLKKLKQLAQEIKKQEDSIPTEQRLQGILYEIAYQIFLLNPGITDTWIKDMNNQINKLK